MKAQKREIQSLVFSSNQFRLNFFSNKLDLTKFFQTNSSSKIMQFPQCVQSIHTHLQIWKAWCFHFHKKNRQINSLVLFCKFRRFSCAKIWIRSKVSKILWFHVKVALIRYITQRWNTLVIETTKIFVS